MQPGADRLLCMEPKLIAAWAQRCIRYTTKTVPFTHHASRITPAANVTRGAKPS
jgi:hypothetical protein